MIPKYLCFGFDTYDSMGGFDDFFAGATSEVEARLLCERSRWEETHFVCLETYKVTTIKQRGV